MEGYSGTHKALCPKRSSVGDSPRRPAPSASRGVLGRARGARGARVGGAHGGRAWGARRWLPPPNFRGGDAVRAIRLLSPWAVVRIPVPAFPFCPTSHSLPQAPSSRAWRPEVHLPTGWAWGSLHLAPAEGLNNKCKEEGVKSPQHVMAPTLNFYTNPWMWSKCSRKYITEFLE